MFDKALLESSPARAPVLKKRHYLFAAACGAVSVLAGAFALGQLSPAMTHRAATAESVLFGAVDAAFALMVCYVYAESRELGMNATLWVTLTCLLNLPGFVCFLIAAAAKTGDWKRAAIPIVYIGEVLVVGAMALVPLIYTEALPKAIWREVIQAPLPPPGPPAPVVAETPRRQTRTLRPEDLLKMSASIPPTIGQVHDEPLPPAESSPIGGIQGAINNGPFTAAFDPVMRNLFRNSTPPPPVTQREKPTQPTRIRLGGVVTLAKLIYQPKLEYPELARISRTEGAVELEAVIGKDGTIEELKVLRGHPLLVNAAIQAVRHWRYQPTLLNGEPVEVVTEITVNFKLAE